MLPSPSISFTIPSLHDELALDCRIYLPTSLDVLNNRDGLTWNGKTAIVSHPYGPLGGSYDDPIVELLVSTIVGQGFIVATFNFRGSGGSKGHTSWTAKPEIDDYMSVVGFTVLFTRHLVHYATEPLILLMAGYSYGALITTLIPDLSDIVERFDAPHPTKNALLIIETAATIALKEKERLESLRLRATLLSPSFRSPTDDVLTIPSPTDRHSRKSFEAHPSERRSLTVVRYGGDDPHRRISFEGHRRVSHDHVEDVLRRGVSKLRSISRNRPVRHSSDIVDPKVSPTSPLGHSPLASDFTTSSDLQHTTQFSGVQFGGRLSPTMPYMSSAYLIISPLQGLVKHLTTFWSSPPSKHASEPRVLKSEELKLSKYPTLAIWGEKDAFTAAKKLQAWSLRMRIEKHSLFRGVEIENAGHFWHEQGVAEQLRVTVKDYVCGLGKNM